jgi:hypothetical protein
MKDSTRARVAAVVGAAAKKDHVSSVYDYNSGIYRRISANVERGCVSGFDYRTSTHLTGSGANNTLSFYDYETSSHVQLQLNGDQFSGFDYHTNSHFSGTINGNSISLYDYGTGQHYSFSA